jgi:[ribosomal protein S5]-alanine N-acetyltransferase
VIYRPITAEALTGRPDVSPLVREVCEQILALMARTGAAMPWGGYLIEAAGAIVGTCAFKAPPSAGRIEIAYFTFPGHEGHGYASRAAGFLIDTARANDPKLVIVAQTLPEENASTAILRKHRFTRTAEIYHPEDGRIWEWELAGDAGSRTACGESVSAARHRTSQHD